MIEKKINGIHFSAGTWPPEPERKTLLFIHGSGNTRRLWKNQVGLLADEVNTVALDLPGHGLSEGTGFDTVEDYAKSVKKFIADTGLKKFIPCGLSLGGAVVLQLLLDAPSLCEAGILVNTGARLRVMPAIFETIRNHYDSYVASLSTVAAAESTDEALLKDIIEDVKTMAPDIVMGDFSACNRFDVMDRLGEIRLPVLVLSADEDRLAPVKYGTHLAENIPAARHVIIEKAGHMSPVEKPGELCNAIEGFIESLG